MEIMDIHGGKTLAGSVTVGGAKNSTVALIPASILSHTKVVFDSVPQIKDVENLRAILGDMNVPSTIDESVLTIDPSNIKQVPLTSGKIQSLRASYYFMGALLSRFGEAVVSFPGGDDIGPRPIDQHIRGFQALGATVHFENDSIHIKAPDTGLVGTMIKFDFISVGATINMILASVLAHGQTTIENAAREPEIIDLATFLNNMGARIRGAGTSQIKIEGVESLSSKNSHTIIPDRIEAGTYIIIAAAIGNGIWIKNVIPEHLDLFLGKLEEMGVNMQIGEDSVYVYPTERLVNVEIKTSPFPGFATDLQQPISSLMFLGEGQGVIHDTIYPKRVRHIPELCKMGAKIWKHENEIRILKSDHLQGTDVTADEIRAGASLMITGLIAPGETRIHDAGNILRGYDRVVHKLRSLGAEVRIIDEQ
ncbi:UDP-N-acetylglucosamine 1-carboxyvinyltransferase [Xylocopilactobacillus apicola]|uniref:UDP-N-acetylglucosamine 1-carboxyvinyltransferase n=1 Tax=Xylocopilactobacillus apicola TaxID=2932184 RepID=A0AAU9CWX3_9LACO|nr:UDP-N-acetylglucosamine 1-carboxyvinyltransferase [Xylocopilactobacillus apicola]BDR58469.1 UDP-N-acetylglucosamine 1-carboxyvinyltransferase [Xylocopilactobacillus apicola]